MVRPKEVRAREGYRLWLRYDDGVEGEVDLSDIAGRGVFAAWRDRAFFQAVRLDEAGAIAWGENIDLCPDALYLRITGRCLRRYFPRRGCLVPVPELSRFYGIVIRMYYDDHLPPHFHALYDRHEALMGIETLALVGGRLPPRAMGNGQPSIKRN